MVTKLAILGSTGSIGTQALDIVRMYPKEFQITALTAGKNAKLLQQQINEFKPLAVAINHKSQKITNTKKVFDTQEGISQIAQMPQHDIVLNALVGTAGVLPSWHAINAGHHVALANKESLVAAGELLTELAKKKKCDIIPVDSEHSAIFQCLGGKDTSNVRRIILTCSGGPFRTTKTVDLAIKTAKEALQHPTWKMGGKISIDSATLMNKGFEIIETKWLYDYPIDKVEIIIHPQSIVHSFVEYEDKSMVCQLSYPDMKIPIQFALTYPRHRQTQTNPLNLADVQKLEFEAWNAERFPAPTIAKGAAKLGKTYPAVLNAANEEAVYLFLEGKILFPEIVSFVKKALEQHKPLNNHQIDDVIAIDKQVKQQVRSWQL